MAEIETLVIYGFDELKSCLEAMRRIERLEISRTCQMSNKDVAIRFSMHPEEYKDKKARLKLAAEIPEYNLSLGLGGNAKLIKLYEELCLEEVKKQNGRVVNIDGEKRKAWVETCEGCSQKVIRMFEPYGSFGTIVACAPISSVEGMNATIREIVKKYELMDPVLESPLTPELLVIPWDRCSTVYVEHEILYDPLIPEDVNKATNCLRDCYVAMFSKFGGCHTIPNRTFLRMMMPSYVNLLLGIKRIVDPNGLMLAGGPYSFEPLS
jgi:hypothetical protein